MPLLQTKYSQKYTLLLSILIFRFLTSPFFWGGIGEVFSSLIMLLTLVSVVRIFCLRKQLYYTYITVAGLAFFIEAIANINWISTYNYHLSLFSLVIYSLYLGIAVLLIMKEIFLAAEVTLDTIFGGISVYLLIGFVWSFFYGQNSPEKIRRASCISVALASTKLEI